MEANIPVAAFLWMCHIRGIKWHVETAAPTDGPSTAVPAAFYRDDPAVGDNYWQVATCDVFVRLSDEQIVRAAYVSHSVEPDIGTDIR